MKMGKEALSKLAFCKDEAMSSLSTKIVKPSQWREAGWVRIWLLSDLKVQVQELSITMIKDTEVGGRKAIVIFVPVSQLNSF